MRLRVGPAERAAPQPGDPVYGAPDAGLSLVPREPGAKPVAEVESYDEVSGKIVLRGLSPSTIEIGCLERAVLDACAELDLDTYLHGDEHEQRAVAEAELARRVAKEGT